MRLSNDLKIRLFCSAIYFSNLILLLIISANLPKIEMQSKNFCDYECAISKILGLKIMIIIISL